MSDIDRLTQRLDYIERSLVKTTESECLNDLFAALAKAQQEMEIAKNDSLNPFFKSKYSDLASVIKASRPYLSKNGLCVIQLVRTEPQGLYLYTRLAHASGQWIESKMPIDPAKKDIQSLGSHMTYVKRYSYAAIVGVVSGEEDDDGENAMQRGLEDDQVQILEELIDGDEGLKQKILKVKKVDALSKLPKECFTNLIQWIKKEKAA